MSKYAGIRSKIEFIGSLNPQAWDAIKPHTPFVFSNAHVELMVADTVKNISAMLADQKLGTQVKELSHKMATEATRAMVAAWEPGDDICPPWPFPFPWPRPNWADGPVQGPHPEPWKALATVDQIQLAYSLTQLAGLTTSKDYNVALKGLATEIARGAANAMIEDFDRCGTVPRKPFPPRPH